MNTGNNRVEVLVERLQHGVALRLRKEIGVHRERDGDAVVIAQQRAKRVQVDGGRHGEDDLVDGVAVHHQLLLRTGQRGERDGGGLAIGESKQQAAREVDVDRIGYAPRERAHEVHQLVHHEELCRREVLVDLLTHHLQTLQRVLNVHRHLQDAQCQVCSLSQPRTLTLVPNHLLTLRDRLERVRHRCHGAP